MPKFSQRSLSNLATCHPDLQVLFNEVIKYFDFTITEGHRNRADQEKAFSEGKSKLHYPNGKHNAFPSNAVDAYPYPIDFNDSSRIYYFSGFVMGIAQKLKDEGKISHSIRYGGDWNMNNLVKDESFQDTGHFELII